MTANLWIISGLILLQVGIGCLASWRIKTSDDFFLGGRRNGYLLISFSVFATWFGSESCISSSGLFYDHGFAGGRADPFGYAISLAAFGILFAPRIWRAQITTLSDLFRTRYGHAVEVITAIILLITSLFWAAGQLRAFGHILSSHTHLSLNLLIPIATTVAVVYTVMGGLIADTYSDLFQGAIIIASLTFLSVSVYLKFPEPATLLAQLPAERLMLLSTKESMLTQLDGWIVPILGSMVAQELVSRVSAAKSAVVARRGAIIAAVLYLCVGMMPGLLGVLGPLLIPDINHSEQFLIQLAEKVLPRFAFLAFTSSLVAAILSTVDSALLAVSAFVTRNLVPLVLPDLGQKATLKVARLAVISAGTVSCLIAMSANSVYELVVLASSFGTGGILVATAFTLYTKHDNRAGGFWSILLGAISYIAFEVLDAPAPYLMSIIVALVAYLVPLLLLKKVPSTQ